MDGEDHRGLAEVDAEEAVSTARKYSGMTPYLPALDRALAALEGDVK